MFYISFFRNASILLMIILITCFSASGSGESQIEILDMTLSECIDVALKNNLDIQLKALEIDISEENINLQKSSFDPYLTSQLYYINSVSPNTYILEEVSNLETRSIGKSISVSQKLPTGTTYDVSMTTSRQKYNATLQGLNPTYNADLNLSITQPLLQNIGPAVNKAYISISMNNKKISLIDLKKKMSDVIYSVINRYWNLVYRIEDLNAKEKSLELARELMELNKTEIEVGTLAPVELYQAKSAVATREEAVIIAQNAVNQAQDNLLNIINLKDKKVPWSIVDIYPVESPSPEFTETDLHESIKMALRFNHDLNQSKLYLDNWDIQLKHDKNQMLPELDLSGGVTLDGLAGEVSYESGEYPFEGDFMDAYGMLLDGDYYSYNISIALEIPIFNRSARSSYAKSNIEKRKQIIRLKQLENEIILGVRNLIRSINTNRKRIDVTETAKILAEKKLEVEQEKYRLGLTTNYAVLDFQEDLEIALNSEIKAKIDYQLSRASLKNLEGTLLDDYQFSLTNLKSQPSSE